jgi:membrane protease YdiL (CAAX protease family)
MKKIWNFLKTHVREDFNIGHYVTTALFLAAAIYLNYSYDFEDSVLDTKKGFDKYLHYFVFYAIAFYFTTLSYLIFSKKLYVLVEGEFWIKSLAAIAVLSLDSSAPFLRDMVNDLFNPALQFWAYKVAINLMSFVVIFIPLMILYFVIEKEQKNYYGLSARKFDFTPYIIMLLIMIPLIAAASFHESFLRQYPMYKPSGAHSYLNVPEWVTAAGYEAAYALDFITVEFLFRGFLVIGLMSVMGRGAVLTMAVTYCFLHFGKPAGEAISSIFGGYILGVIAYETKSIWGGIVIHVGIALGMELAAYLQKNI